MNNVKYNSSKYGNKRSIDNYLKRLKLNTYKDEAYRNLCQLECFFDKVEKKNELAKYVLKIMRRLKDRGVQDTTIFFRGFKHLSNLNKKSFLSLLNSALMIKNKIIPEEFYRIYSSNYKYTEKEEFQFLLYLHENILGRFPSYYLTEESYVKLFVESIRELRDMDMKKFKEISNKYENLKEYLKETLKKKYGSEIELDNRVNDIILKSSIRIFFQYKGQKPLHFIKNIQDI